MPAIEFQNVVFAYGDRTILKNVNFVIEQGICRHFGRFGQR